MGNDAMSRLLYLDGKGEHRTFEEELEMIQLRSKPVKEPRTIVVVAVVFLDESSDLTIKEFQDEVQSNLESEATTFGIKSVIVHAHEVEVP